MSYNATASWSGYAHQGKVGIFISLRNINNTFGELNRNLGDYSIEYETQEDVVLKHQAIPIEVHQVKALLGSTTIGSYTEAIGQFTVCPGNNFLHSICEITNWANLTAEQNPNSIQRYIYPNGDTYCPLDEINTLIDNEIRILLQNENHAETDNDNWRLESYYNLLGVLDDKIRTEHATKAQVNYQIHFTLAEIQDIIFNRPTNSVSKLSSIRQELYNCFVGFFQDLQNNHFAVTADHEQRILSTLSTIYGMPDKEFEQFLRDINPHTTEGIIFGTHGTTDKYFVLENFRAVFLESIIHVTPLEPVVKINLSPHYLKNKYYLLTSINSPIGQIKTTAQRILKNSKVNFTNYEADFIITEQYTGTLGSHASTLIDYDEKKFFNPKTIAFISKADAIAELNS